MEFKNNLTHPALTCDVRRPSLSREGQSRACEGWGESKRKQRTENLKIMSNDSTPVKRARELRRNMTEAEQMLWKEIRNRKLMRLKFLRQHPIIYQVIDNKPKYFIADFMCYEKNLVIEVDGLIHEFQQDDDEHREEILKSRGLNILRIKNEEVEDISKVLEKIRGFINGIKNNCSHPAPIRDVRRPSLAREGQSRACEGWGESKNRN